MGTKQRANGQNNNPNSHRFRVQYPLGLPCGFFKIFLTERAKLKGIKKHKKNCDVCKNS
jgi:hypothetical protein